MTAQDNKALVRRIVEDMNAVRGDPARMRSFYQKWASPRYTHHNLAGAELSLEQRIQSSSAAVAALPDLTYIIDDIIAEGDKTATMFTMRATHKGTYLGVPATGKQVEVHFCPSGKVFHRPDFGFIISPHKSGCCFRKLLHVYEHIGIYIFTGGGVNILKSLLQGYRFIRHKLADGIFHKNGRIADEKYIVINGKNKVL